MDSLEGCNATVAVREPARSRGYRIAVFGYGVAAYLVGVGALVGLVLVMLGVRRFSGGPLAPMELAPALALDALLLVAFAIQHSVMARPGFKARWTRVVPAEAERSTYMLATGLALGLLLALWQPMPHLVWSLETPLLRWLVLATALAGWGYLLAASFAIDHFELFGLRQVYRTLRRRPLGRAPFRERWMYRFDRHPIMTGILVGVWAAPTMRLDHLLFAAGCTAYICIGVFFEERSLAREWGRRYDEYRERVGTIVPGFGGRRSQSTRASAATRTR